MKVTLVDKVIQQIIQDVAEGDLTAIEELIADIPETKLQGFLPNDEVEILDLEA